MKPNKMSNLIINIRIYIYHFQMDDRYKFKITKNNYHKGNKETPFCDIYKFFNYKS